MPETSLNPEAEFLQIREQLHSYLYRLAANKADAEDLVQDTFLRVKEKAQQFQGNSSFKTWVFSIATNLARDNRRVQNRWELNAQDACRTAAETVPENTQRIISAFQAQPEQRFELAEHINYCFTCIAKNLKLEQQIAIILKEFYHFRRKEIAAILKKPEGVIKHLLHDGRKALQEKYEKRCALINKNGPCYQCAELNDFLQPQPDATEKIVKMGLSPEKDEETNLDLRFTAIQAINPLNSPGAELEDTILQILREAIEDQ